MPVSAKPFDVAQKIVRSIFAGKPSVFSAQDLNRQFDVLDYANTKTRKDLGIYRDGWDVTPSVMVYIVTTDKTVDITLTTTTGYAHVKNTRLTVPVATVSFSKVYALSDQICVNLWLVATRSTVTFSDDPTLSGINSTDAPTMLPSSDTVVYKDERLVLSDTAPTLAAGEEIIGIIGSVVEQDNVVADGTVNGTTTTVLAFVFNALTLDDLLYFYRYGSYKDAATATTGYQANPSVFDVLVYMRKWLYEFKGYVRARFSYFDAFVGSQKVSATGHYITVGQTLPDADNVLDGAIWNERTRALAAETTLTNTTNSLSGDVLVLAQNIGNEVTRATAAEDAIGNTWVNLAPSYTWTSGVQTNGASQTMAYVKIGKTLMIVFYFESLTSTANSRIRLNLPAGMVLKSGFKLVTTGVTSNTDVATRLLSLTADEAVVGNNFILIDSIDSNTLGGQSTVNHWYSGQITLELA